MQPVAVKQVTREEESRRLAFHIKQVLRRKFGNIGINDALSPAFYGIGHREHIHLTCDIAVFLAGDRSERLVKSCKQTRAVNSERVERTRLYQRLDHSAVQFSLRHSVKEVRERRKRSVDPFENKSVNELSAHVFEC